MKKNMYNKIAENCFTRIGTWIPDREWASSDGSRTVRIVCIICPDAVNAVLNFKSIKSKKEFREFFREGFRTICVKNRSYRHEDGEIRGGKYSFPGGHIKNGENMISGALREFREETGVRLNYLIRMKNEWLGIPTRFGQYFLGIIEPHQLRYVSIGNTTDICEVGIMDLFGEMENANSTIRLFQKMKTKFR